MFRINNFRLEIFYFAGRVALVLEDLPLDHLGVFCSFDAWLFENGDDHRIASQSTRLF